MVEVKVENCAGIDVGIRHAVAIVSDIHANRTAFENAQ